MTKEPFMPHHITPTRAVAYPARRPLRQPWLDEAAELLGRVLLAALFFISGAAKLASYAAMGAYMAAAGVPAFLLPLVIATELLGALAIMLGWKTRMTAVLL